MRWEKLLLLGNKNTVEVMIDRIELKGSDNDLFVAVQKKNRTNLNRIVY